MQDNDLINTMAFLLTYLTDTHMKVEERDREGEYMRGEGDVQAHMERGKHRRGEEV